MSQAIRDTCVRPEAIFRLKQSMPPSFPACIATHLFIAFLSSSPILANCARASVTASVPAGTSDEIQKFRAVAYMPRNLGTYVLLEQQPTGDWTTVDEYTDRLYPQNSNQEVLYLVWEAGPGSTVLISGGFPRVKDFFAAAALGGFDEDGSGLCNPLRRGDIQVTNGCSSRLVKPRPRNVAAASITFGAPANRAVTAGMDLYEIDPDAIRALVLHSDLFSSPLNYQLFQKARAEREYQVRWANCASRTSIRCYYEFATTYGGLGSAGTYDPEGYAARARDIVLERTTTNAARIERRADTLRRSLHSGSETNFGHVLEVSGTSVRVAVTPQLLGIEQWVPIRYIYPPGVASANFYNGEPQRPTLDQQMLLGE
jgi:hypothetical protein